MSESKLKYYIKLIEKDASLGDVSKALHLTETIVRHTTNNSTKSMAKTLESDLQDMKSKGKVNDGRIQFDVASLFMLA